MSLLQAVRHAIGPTGGLSYHWIASRNVDSRWRSFRTQVRSWLLEWQAKWPQGSNAITELVIFGPSAGWTLPLADFKTIPKMTFVEPDPIARALLKNRFGKSAPGTPVQIQKDPKILPWFSDDPGSFQRFVDERPNAAFLFSNLLGQIALLQKPSRITSDPAETHLRSAQDEFLNALSGRVWASYHDLYSTNTAAHLKTSELHVSENADVSKSLSQIAIETFPSAQSLTDHETSWLSVGRKTELAIWPLSKSQIHLIGFVKEV